MEFNVNNIDDRPGSMLLFIFGYGRVHPCTNTRDPGRVNIPVPALEHGVKVTGIRYAKHCLLTSGHGTANTELV